METFQETISAPLNSGKCYQRQINLGECKCMDRCSPLVWLAWSFSHGEQAHPHITGPRVPVSGSKPGCAFSSLGSAWLQKTNKNPSWQLKSLSVSVWGLWCSTNWHTVEETIASLARGEIRSKRACSVCWEGINRARIVASTEVN